MKLSIIILYTFDKEVLHVKNILKYFKKYAPKVSYEILLVSNGNKKWHEELKKDYSDMKNLKFILNSGNLGYGKGNHKGIEKAKGEYILVLNPDIELYEGNLDLMVAHMDNEPSIGVLAPQLIYEDGTIQDVYRRFPSVVDFLIKRTFLRKLPIFKERMHKYLMHDVNPELVEDVDWVVGACILIRRKMYDEVGGFDPRYFLFLEDTDLCRAMWEHRHRVVYFPRAKATHFHERLSAGGLSSIFKKKTVRIHIKSAIKYFWKHKFRAVPHVTPIVNEGKTKKS